MNCSRKLGFFNQNMSISLTAIGRTNGRTHIVNIMQTKGSCNLSRTKQDSTQCIYKIYYNENRSKRVKLNMACCFLSQINRVTLKIKFPDL